MYEVLELASMTNMADIESDVELMETDNEVITIYDDDELVFFFFSYIKL